ncbi:unnamed protein product [Peronospora belbahrii]|uniref:Uncharacterized protein n=1 Tax=Peronospora belbahrii TaxID=622444 RepID=A0AAU9KSH9_9STRA|nr:unnamed protein product [Peronospora belbahrii]
MRRLRRRQTIQTPGEEKGDILWYIDKYNMKPSEILYTTKLAIAIFFDNTLRYFFTCHKAQVLQHVDEFLIHLPPWLRVKHRHRAESVAVTTEDRRTSVVAGLHGTRIALDHRVLAKKDRINDGQKHINAQFF